MLKLFIFVLILITLVLLSIFMVGVRELHKKEKDYRKNIIRDGMEGYLDKTFGFGNVTIFKSILDADGNTRYLVYLPKYEWFKSPQYEWYDVYATQSGFKHEPIKS
ncbi:hypothetical protein [Neobacillus sp. DY30]|uniref:hypothetical protein n=1 Tax=Neobacillus sp. DY30 TaxID=3047871 RepID=UPI0024BFDC21|nr:hypothetical protein [Neobacillus sp. DY30]WHY03101.1 hypothetical protein QNH29_13160 [Neobacillus sp. DY30]